MDGFRCLFGGFRLWHEAPARDNSEDNRWRSNEELPDGGYMDDLWVCHQPPLNPDEPMPTSSAGLGLWRNYRQVRRVWTSRARRGRGRDDQNCEVEWPTARAGHTSALDAKNGDKPRSAATLLFSHTCPLMVPVLGGEQQQNQMPKDSFPFLIIPTT